MPRRRGGRRPNKDKNNPASNPNAEGANKEKAENAPVGGSGNPAQASRGGKPSGNKPDSTNSTSSTSNRSRKSRGKSRNRNKDHERTDTIEHPLPDYVEYVMGELFENANNAKAVAFGCHPEGEFNTELTIKFRQKHPELYAEYVNACQAGTFVPGSMLAWKTRDGLMVYMLATQRDKYLQLATPQEIETAFQKVREHADENQIDSIAMPQIGSGLGALNWPRSRRALERAFKGWQGKLFVYTKPEKIERERL